MIMSAWYTQPYLLVHFQLHKEKNLKPYTSAALK